MVPSALYGEDGNDRLSGVDADDLLDGGAGDDVLLTGSNDDADGSDDNTVIQHRILSVIVEDGGDELLGGTGRDTFALFRTWHSPEDNPDIIGDFDFGQDRVGLKGFVDAFGFPTTPDFLGTDKFAGSGQCGSPMVGRRSTTPPTATPVSHCC